MIMLFNGSPNFAHIGVLWESQMVMRLREPWVIPDREQVLKKSLFICSYSWKVWCQSWFNEWHLCETKSYGFL